MSIRVFFIIATKLHLCYLVYMQPIQFDCKEILRARGHKATPGRILLLTILMLESKPVTVLYLEKKLKNSIDKVTLYRSLQSMVASGLVREVDFRHGHTHYEIEVLREHHHHIVCTGCNKIEDTRCDIDQVVKKSLAFKEITDHAIEFFGRCRSCA